MPRTFSRPRWKERLVTLDRSWFRRLFDGIRPRDLWRSSPVPRAQTWPTWSCSSLIAPAAIVGSLSADLPEGVARHGSPVVSEIFGVRREPGGCWEGLTP